MTRERCNRQFYLTPKANEALERIYIDTRTDTVRPTYSQLVSDALVWYGLERAKRIFEQEYGESDE